MPEKVREGAENGEVFAIAKVKLQAVKFVLRTSEVKFATLPKAKLHYRR